MWNTETAPDEGLGLGIDAGGTQTRWALARADGSIVAEGEVAGLSALQMAAGAGRGSVHGNFVQLAKDAMEHGHPSRVRAGLTGFGGDGDQMSGWLAQIFKLPPAAVVLCNDIEIAYLDCFAPGEGYLVYAGTGSIAGWIDTNNKFHRAGGRGVMLDDGGGGFWIAREALRHIWRGEDEEPGRWRQSALARAVFDEIGGSEWDISRQYIYGQDRGAVGKLALCVAATAETDPVSHDILVAAGQELARLAVALTVRFGPRPVLLTGRASGLHPLIVDSMRAALPAGTVLTQSIGQAHLAAARIAARSAAEPLPE